MKKFGIFYKLSYMDKPLLFLMIGLSIFGSFMIFSASNISAVKFYGVAPYYFFTKQLIFIVAGLFAFFIVAFIPYRNYRKFSVLAYVAVLFLLVFVMFSGHAAKNAQSWIRLGPITIQPSEFAKLAIIVMLAGYYEKNARRVRDWANGVILPVIVALVPIILVLMQPDFGTAMIMVMLTYLLVLVSNVSPKIKNLIGALSALIVIVGLLGYNNIASTLFKGEKLERLEFGEPCLRYEDGGYHVCNSQIAINNGGWFGVGLGGSTQKYLYLPEAHTDFIFAIILEELGFLMSLGILSLYGVLIYRGIRIALRAPDISGSMIAFGSTALIFLHIIINLGGISGMMPLTGVPFPLLSAGGSFILTSYISMGMIQSVAIKINLPIESK